MKILILGHRSFASRGLPDLLKSKNHEVITFSRGPLAKSECEVTGPLESLCENQYLQTQFDAVINYIYLREQSVDANLEYIKALLEFCRKQRVRHLIHISSVSAYETTLESIDEDARVEANYLRKGGYGSVKAATDRYVLDHAPEGTIVSLIRPGFILGKGMVSPLTGNAARLPWGALLAIGNAKTEMPLISRDLLNESILRIVTAGPPQNHEALLVVANNLPNRAQFVDALNTILGCGTGVITVPKAFWWFVAATCETAQKISGRSFPKGMGRVPQQRFDSRKTQQRIGMKLEFDWRATLQESLEGQSQDFALPYSPAKKEVVESLDHLNRITFVGCGRIVKTKYLPALRRAKFKGNVEAYDLVAQSRPGELEVKGMQGATLGKSDLTVVATPGPVHIQSIPILKTTRGPILIEKPLCYSHTELDEWSAFAKSRDAGVFVCHNYRFKRNVVEMLKFMKRFNPGELKHVNLHFESPSVSDEAALWMRDERKARTLLMDYSLHFLDLALMFGRGDWKVGNLDYQTNSSGQTSLIQGQMKSDNYTVSLLLRQGFGARKTQILFNFQNYSTILSFFPDTFTPHVGSDNPWQHISGAWASGLSTASKIKDKLTKTDSDSSHALVMAAASNVNHPYSSSIRIENLIGFYKAIFEISKRVYGN